MVLGDTVTENFFASSPVVENTFNSENAFFDAPSTSTG